MAVRLRCLLAWLLAAPFAAMAAGARPVTLGLVAPPNEPDSASLLHGVQLAVVEANAAGPAPVRLEVRGSAGQWGTVGNDAVALVCSRHVDALITPSDGASSHLMLQVASRTRVPVATLCADSSVTEAGVPWAVRVVPRNDQEAGALFAAARSAGRPALHWWAVVPSGRPGRTVRSDLETAARATATPLDRIVEEAGPDPAALAGRIAAAAPGGVLLWLPPARAGALAAALRRTGYRGRLAGPSPLDSRKFVAAAGAAAAGVLVTEFRVAAGDGVRAAQFARQFHRRYGVAPDASAAAAYDAARVLIAAVRRAGDRPGYSEFPLALSIPGVTGVLHFDGSGNRLGALQVLTCEQGRFVPAISSKT